MECCAEKSRYGVSRQGFEFADRDGGGKNEDQVDYPLDTVFAAIVPPGVAPGHHFAIDIKHERHVVLCPNGAHPGKVVLPTLARVPLV